jgi:hypothetical protein
MILLPQNLKSFIVPFIICIIILTGYFLQTKEVKAHRPEWQVSQGFATPEKVVEFLNLEQVHDCEVVVDSKGEYRVIYEED